MEESNIDFIDELEEYPLTLNFGPSHPATHGTLHMVVKVDGERILKITPHCGYLHTGFEKLAEHRSYNQFVIATDRMNYLSAMNNNIGYVCAVEECLGIEITPKCKVIRIIMAELSRIADHIVCVGLMGLDTNAYQTLMRCFIPRERIYDLFQMAAGGRLTTSYTRVGGVAGDLPKGFIKEAEDVLKVTRKELDDIVKLLAKNRIWQDRMRNVGVIAKDDAINWGFSGPCLRASGVNYDIRKVRPYLGYENFDFEVPTANEGDNYARFVVRVAEIKQSLRIIEQAFDNIPSGPLNYYDEKLVLPPKDNVYNDMESLIYHFKTIMPGHGFTLPVGEYYHSTEVPNGELGFYIVSSGEDYPYRVRVRPPSFLHFQAVKHLLQGGFISDIPAVLSTLNVIAGELDR